MHACVRACIHTHMMHACLHASTTTIIGRYAYLDAAGVAVQRACVVLSLHAAASGSGVLYMATDDSEMVEDVERELASLGRMDQGQGQAAARQTPRMATAEESRAGEGRWGAAAGRVRPVTVLHSGLLVVNESGARPASAATPGEARAHAPWAGRGGARMAAWEAAVVDWCMMALSRDAVLTHGSTFGVSGFALSRAVQGPGLVSRMLEPVIEPGPLQGRTAPVLPVSVPCVCWVAGGGA